MQLDLGICTYYWSGTATHNVVSKSRASNCGTEAQSVALASPSCEISLSASLSNTSLALTDLTGAIENWMNGRAVEIGGRRLLIGAILLAITVGATIASIGVDIATAVKNSPLDGQINKAMQDLDSNLVYLSNTVGRGADRVIFELTLNRATIKLVRTSWEIFVSVFSGLMPCLMPCLDSHVTTLHFPHLPGQYG